MLWPSCSFKAPININSTAHFCKEGIKAFGVGDTEEGKEKVVQGRAEG